MSLFSLFSLLFVRLSGCIFYCLYVCVCVTVQVIDPFEAGVKGTVELPQMSEVGTELSSCERVLSCLSSPY